MCDCIVNLLVSLHQRIQSLIAQDLQVQRRTLQRAICLTRLNIGEQARLGEVCAHLRTTLSTLHPHTHRFACTLGSAAYALFASGIGSVCFTSKQYSVRIR